MLFERRLRDGIRDGSITLAFRRWKRRQVSAGGQYRMGDGLMALVTEVEVVDDATEEEAHAAGFTDRAALMADLDARGDDPIHRLRLQLVDGQDPRDALAQSTEFTAEELARIARLGAWVAPTLKLIAARPEVRAGDLAPEVGMELPPFKINVRKLKNLGLTISLETGYRISPRGAAYLEAGQ